MYDELIDAYPDIIDQLPQRFNSHEFILKLAHQHQGAYIRALAHYADSDRPFAIVHGRLAQLLEEQFSHLVRKVGAEPSRDIFGHANDATLWIKIK